MFPSSPWLALVVVLVLVSVSQGSWQSVECVDHPGMELDGPKGVVMEKHGVYHNNMDCSLVIRPKEMLDGDEIQLLFTFLSVENRFDFVKLYAPADDPRPAVVLTGHLLHPRLLKIQKKSVRIRFVSDRYGRSAGYRAVYHLKKIAPRVPTMPTNMPEPVVCRNERSPYGKYGYGYRYRGQQNVNYLEGRSGRLMGTDNQWYDNSMDCSMVINPRWMEKGEEIVLTFRYIDTEESRDMIYVYIPANSWRPSHRLSGQQQNVVIRTHHHSIRVRFVTNRWYAKTGYDAFFVVVGKGTPAPRTLAPTPLPTPPPTPLPTPLPTPAPTPLPVVSTPAPVTPATPQPVSPETRAPATLSPNPAPPVACATSPGHVLTGRVGTLREQDGAYAPNMDCSIIIRPDDFRDGETLVLTFTLGDTEENWDMVRVYAPETATTPLETASGYSFTGLVVRTKESSMRVQFTSDGMTQLEGYEAQYRVEYAPPPTPPPSCVAETTCNGNGYCDGDVCKCFDGFAGASCSQETACPERVRRSWYDLHVGERKWFQDAVWELKKKGDDYLIFTRLHNTQEIYTYAHGTSGFLPWHRAFIWEFETALRELGGRYKCVTLPYWPSEIDAALPNHGTAEIWRPTPVGWGGGYGGCVRDPYFQSWVANDGFCLTRSFGPDRLIGEQQVIMTITSNPTYGGQQQGFRDQLEGNAHSMPHLFTGGHMLGFEAPDDPIFFLHHSNVDRLWALWQDCHDHDRVAPGNIRDETYEGSGAGGVRDGIDDLMPFRLANGADSRRFNNLQITPRDVHSIKSGYLSYSYANNDRLASMNTLRAGCQTMDWFHTTGRHQNTLDSADDLEEVVRSFLRSLRHPPTPADVRQAAVLECLSEKPTHMPQDWVTKMLGKHKRVSDYPLACD